MLAFHDLEEAVELAGIEINIAAELAQDMALWQLIEHFVEQLCALEIADGLERAGAKIITIVLDNIIAESVEGIDINLVCRGAGDLYQPAAHGIGGLIGIGEAEYLVGLHLCLASEEVGNAHREYFCFAGARPGYDHNGAIYGINSFTLPLVEVIVSV